MGNAVPCHQGAAFCLALKAGSIRAAALAAGCLIRAALRVAAACLLARWTTNSVFGYASAVTGAAILVVLVIIAANVDA